MVPTSPYYFQKTNAVLLKEDFLEQLAYTDGYYNYGIEFLLRRPFSCTRSPKICSFSVHHHEGLAQHHITLSVRKQAAYW